MAHSFSSSGRIATLASTSLFLGALFSPPIGASAASSTGTSERAVGPSIAAAELRGSGLGFKSSAGHSVGGPTACSAGMADVFPCQNVDLYAVLPASSIGGGEAIEDVWGWTDASTGQEYALAARRNGTSFIDVTDPAQPIYLGDLPSHNGGNSVWRDVKVYGRHAYIVADGQPHGMQVFDLTRLRNVTSPPETFLADHHYALFNNAHNLAINIGTGYAYAVGTNTCSGGLHMIDLAAPLNPTMVGCFSGDGYTADVQCVIYRGVDTEHVGREICFATNEDTLTIVDVTNKSLPVLLSRTSYANSGYVYQGWLTTDHRYFVQDDYLDEFSSGHNTRTYLWELTDLDNPTVVFWEGALPAIDGSQYVSGNHTYQANYTSGLRVLALDGAESGSLVESAFFDSYPEGDGATLDGARSVYPFLRSGTILLSDRNRGLFLLRATLGEIFSDDFESGDTSTWSQTQASGPGARATARRRDRDQASPACLPNLPGCNLHPD